MAYLLLRLKPSTFGDDWGMLQYILEVSLIKKKNAWSPDKNKLEFLLNLNGCLVTLIYKVILYQHQCI